VFVGWCLVKNRENFTFTFTLPTGSNVARVTRRIVDFSCTVSFE
jgi:hypothetical protein